MSKQALAWAMNKSSCIKAPCIRLAGEGRAGGNAPRNRRRYALHSPSNQGLIALTCRAAQRLIAPAFALKLEAIRMPCARHGQCIAPATRLAYRLPAPAPHIYPMPNNAIHPIGLLTISLSCMDCVRRAHLRPIERYGYGLWSTTTMSYRLILAKWVRYTRLCRRMRPFALYRTKAQA